MCFSIYHQQVLKEYSKYKFSTSNTLIRVIHSTESNIESPEYKSTENCFYSHCRCWNESNWRPPRTRKWWVYFFKARHRHRYQFYLFHSPKGRRESDIRPKYRESLAPVKKGLYMDEAISKTSRFRWMIIAIRISVVRMQWCIHQTYSFRLINDTHSPFASVFPLSGTKWREGDRSKVLLKITFYSVNIVSN